MQCFHYCNDTISVLHQVLHYPSAYHALNCSEVIMAIVVLNKSWSLLIAQCYKGCRKSSCLSCHYLKCGFARRKSLLRNSRVGSAPLPPCCWLVFDHPDRLCNIPAASMGAGSVKLALNNLSLTLLNPLCPAVVHQLKTSQFTGR